MGIRTPIEALLINSPRPRFPRLFGGMGFGGDTTGGGVGPNHVPSTFGPLRTPIQVVLVGYPGLPPPRLLGGLGVGGSGTTGSGVGPIPVALGEATGYRPAPISEAPPSSLRGAASEKWVQRIVTTVNSIQRGKLNVTLSVTLSANTTTTTITDARISVFSAMIFVPLTANAAAEQAAGGLYVSEQKSGQATITHANSTQTDRDFRIVILA